MSESRYRLKGIDKLQEIDHLLGEKGVDIVRTKPRAQYLGDDSYKVTDETLCMLVGENNILIIHDGLVEVVDDLSPEEIVSKIQRYANEKKENIAR